MNLCLSGLVLFLTALICEGILAFNGRLDQNRFSFCKREAGGNCPDFGGRPNAASSPTVQSFICRRRREFARLCRRSERSCRGERPDRMTRPPVIPFGCWPRRMSAEVAAGYCGEPSV